MRESTMDLLVLLGSVAGMAIAVLAAACGYESGKFIAITFAVPAMNALKCFCRDRPSEKMQAAFERPDEHA